MSSRYLNGVISTLAVVMLLAPIGSAGAQQPLPWQGGQAASDAYRPPQDTYPQQGGAYNSGGGYGGSGSDAYSPGRTDGGYAAGGGDAYVPPDQRSPAGARPSYDSAGVPPSDPGYGQPYTAEPVSPPPVSAEQAQGSAGGSSYDQNEIIGAGHNFFGSISQNLAKAVEYAFQSQGRPNGYILGEDAGGALVLGLRYGEGMLYTKNAGNHKVFWQGPSLGYDAGAEGSKAMVLVYNMTDPSEIYNRFGGIQGSAYLVGGLSVQFQKYNDVTLGIIRSGVGLRLGANVGYLKYTREPTWNPL